MSSQHPEDIFDPRCLDQLAENTSEELLPELVDMFLDEAVKRVAALRQHHENANLEAVQTEAHSLKSGCGTFGALRLQHLAQRIEIAAKDRDLAELRSAMCELPELAEASFDAIARHLAERSAF
ncbi:Hpt domain-containing protein [Thiocystis violacea]|uniref:Hpt domain-containing protein n=1 Tax=Thiocystis violacea TaxID=13725 RepID=UPI0019055610